MLNWKIVCWLLGLIESFLWGFYAGIVYVPIYNFLQRRWGRTKVHDVIGN